MPLKRWFLEVGSCPNCSGTIVLGEVVEEKDGDCVRGTVVCQRCREEYPIVDGIPVLHFGRRREAGS